MQSVTVWYALKKSNHKMADVIYMVLINCGKFCKIQITMAIIMLILI